MFQPSNPSHQFALDMARAVVTSAETLPLCGSSDIRRLKGAVMRLRAWCSLKELPLSSENAIRALTAVYL